MVYSFAMKYVLILLAVVVLVRIDVFLNLFEKVARRTERVEEVKPDELKNERNLISMKEDGSFKQTPRSILLSLFNEFGSSPSKEQRIKILATLEVGPTVFTEKLDSALESSVYQWRDLLISKNPETIQLLVDLQTLLKGENLVMVKKFHSLLLDEDIDTFFKTYTLNDPSCSIVTLLGDNLSPEERMNVFYDREKLFNTFLAKETPDLREKRLATICQNVLRVHMDKVISPSSSNPEGL